MPFSMIARLPIRISSLLSNSIISILLPICEQLEAVEHMRSGFGSLGYDAAANENGGLELTRCKRTPLLSVIRVIK